MKTLKRYGALLLALLMLVGVLASCGDKPADTSDPADDSTSVAESSDVDDSTPTIDEPDDSDPLVDSEITDSEPTDDPATPDTPSSGGTTKANGKKTTTTKKKTTTTAPKKAALSIKGKTFTIATPWGIKPEKAGVGEYEDALLQRYADLEKNYGCKIDFTCPGGGYNGFCDAFVAACLSENYFADIIESQIWQTRSWMRTGYLAELDKINTLNLKDEKWLASKTNLGYYDGHYYGTDFTSFFGRYINFNNGAMLVNLDLLKDKGYDIYKIIKDGQWTREKYREIAKKFTYSKGGKKIDRWGICGINWYNILWATGHRTASWDGKKYVFDMKNAEVLGALQYLLDMQYVDQSISWEWSLSSTYYGVTDLWAKQRVAFYPLDMEWLGYGDEDGAWFLDVDFNYGLIPTPDLSKDKQGDFKGQFYGETRLWSIPKTAAKKNKLEEVGQFMDLWTEPLSTTTSWKEYVKDVFFQDNQQSFDWYQKLLNNAEFDHAVDMGALQIIPFQTTMNNMFTKHEMTPAEAIEQEAEAFQIYLDGFVNNDAKLLKSHK